MDHATSVADGERSVMEMLIKEEEPFHHKCCFLHIILASFFPRSEYNEDELLIVTAVESDTADLVPGFIRSVASHQPEASLLIYDLGVSR